MIQTIGLSQFRDAFQRYSRTDFSYEGLKVLFDYLEECDPQYDLDVIGLCCGYAEDSALSIAADYSIDVKGMGIADIFLAVREYLEENTCVVGVTLQDTFIYAQF